jgi:hypothetical protein
MPSFSILAPAAPDLFNQQAQARQHLPWYYYKGIDATEGHKSSIPPQDFHHYQQTPK